MIKRIATVGGWTLISRISGFIRDVVMAAVLGAGPMADAFFVIVIVRGEPGRYIRSRRQVEAEREARFLRHLDAGRRGCLRKDQ